MENNIDTDILNEIETLGHTKEESKDFDRQRQEANLKILEYIKEYINNNPQLRFIQILWNLDITNHQDRFNEEPQQTLKRIEHRLEQINNMKEKMK
jgi:hypothetical protein